MMIELVLVCVILSSYLSDMQLMGLPIRLDVTRAIAAIRMITEAL